MPSLLPRASSHAHLGRILSVLSLGSLMSLGCANDTTGPAPVDPAHLYYQLTLSSNAITLALTPPYDTLQLVATPRSATGAPLADRGVTTWTSSDTSSLRVSPTGHLTALAPASGVTVLASYTIGAVTQTSTVTVNINDTASVPRMARLTLQPETTVFGLPYYEQFGILFAAPSALDAQGDTIPNVVFNVMSETPTVLTPRTANDNIVQGGGLGVELARNSVGHAIIVTEATVYGVHRVDTLTFTVGWWHQVLVGVHPQYPNGRLTPIGAFVPAEDTVAVGGIVIWLNRMPRQAVDVVFDDPAAAQAVDSATFLGGSTRQVPLIVPIQGGGNIPAFVADSTRAIGNGNNNYIVRARSFPTAGTYRYHSALYGTSGIIHVVPEFQIQ